MNSSCGEWYEILMGVRADVRLSNWPFMTSTFGVFVILTCYWIFCGFFGLVHMQRLKRPMKVLNQLTAYNEFLGISGTILAILSIMCIRLGQYSLTCEPVKMVQLKNLDVIVAILIYAFFMLKITELLGAVYLVLLKRNVSLFLLLHQTFMLFFGWFGARFVPGGTTLVLELISLAAPVTAYFGWKFCRLTGLGDKFSAAKFSLILQVIEFGLIHYICYKVVKAGCGYPSWAANLVVWYNQTYMLLLISPLINGVGMPVF